MASRFANLTGASNRTARRSAQKYRNLSLYMIFNAYWEPLEFELPFEKYASGDPWRRWIDTSRDSPNDIQDWPSAPVVTGQTYRAGPRSVVVLIAAVNKCSKC